MIELPGQVIRLIELALDEDLGTGDLTSEAVLDDDMKGKAVIEAREPLVCCGLEIARKVFEKIEPGVVFNFMRTEGEDADYGDILAELEGSMKTLLAGERTALNFLQRTCGVATLSRRYALLAAGRTVILDSRKTVPGWRWLDKMAVRTGGCSNHRMGLFDGVLIKDNHIAACGSVAKAVIKARHNAPAGFDIEVEVDNLDGLEEALGSGADIIMLDNFAPDEVARAVRICGGRARLEVSGGIGPGNIEAYLDAAKVDYISVGALTHSAQAADIAMEIMTDGS
jgi:nicotinate-nucleotide pyrophosphorylase (carboxylating)